MTITEMGRAGQGRVPDSGKVRKHPKEAALLRRRGTAVAAAGRRSWPPTRLDLEAGREKGMSQALLDRLALTPERIQDMSQAVAQVAQAPDPVGRVLSGETLPNGLQLQKITVPMGVMGIIYEARPNVTSDAAALCVKAGSAVILRGGKEALRLQSGDRRDPAGTPWRSPGLPGDCVQLVQDTSRQSAQELMTLTDYLDVLIPRGGAGLIRSVKENARVPVIETGSGQLPRVRGRSPPTWTWPWRSSSTPSAPGLRCAMPLRPSWSTEAVAPDRSAPDQGQAGRETGGAPRLPESPGHPAGNHPRQGGGLGH